MQDAIDQINANPSNNVLADFNLTLSVAYSNDTTEGTYNAVQKLLDDRVAFVIEYFAFSPQNLALSTFAANILTQFGVPYGTSNVASDMVAMKNAIAMGQPQYVTISKYLSLPLHLGFKRCVFAYATKELTAATVNSVVAERRAYLRTRVVPLTSTTPETFEASELPQILSEREAFIILYLPLSTTKEYICRVKKALGDNWSRIVLVHNLPMLEGPDQEGVCGKVASLLMWSKSEKETTENRQAVLNRVGPKTPTDSNYTLTTLYPEPYGTYVFTWAFSRALEANLQAAGFDRARRAAIATSFQARPTVNRSLYINEVLNFQPRLHQLISYQDRNQTNVAFELCTRVNPSQPECSFTPEFPDANGTVTLIKNFTFNDGTTTKPADVIPAPFVSFGPSSAIGKAFIAMGIIVFLLSIVLLALLFKHRNEKALKCLAPLFVATITGGCMLLAATMLVLAQDPLEVPNVCYAVPVTVDLAFHLIVVSVLVKQYRLFMIFDYPGYPMAVKDRQLGAALVISWIPDLVVFILWFVLDPPAALRVDVGSPAFQTVSQCVSKSTGWAWGISAYAFLKLILAFRYSYLTRNVASEYNESKSSIFTIYNLVLCIALGILGTNGTSFGKLAESILVMVALSLAAIITFSFLVGSKLLVVWIPHTRKYELGKLSVIQSLPSNGASAGLDSSAFTRSVGSVDHSGISYVCAVRSEKFAIQSRWYSCIAEITKPRFVFSATGSATTLTPATLTIKAFQSEGQNAFAEPIKSCSFFDLVEHISPSCELSDGQQDRVTLVYRGTTYSLAFTSPESAGTFVKTLKGEAASAKSESKLTV
ncbi:hypothetical protein HK102_005247 [Quaeritorhiza haematococci]|nr:hypothetical protein HK102_005247 [Quaeritorhiza haematococci]